MFRLIESQVLFRGARLSLELHHLEDENGQHLRKEVIIHPGAVVILPVLDNGSIVLIRSYRYALRDFLLELPAGTLNKGELPLNAAGRELLEETGYLAGRLNQLSTFYPTPGITNEVMHLFVASQLAPRQQKLEPDERIEVVITPLADALAMIADGQIRDLKTIAGLMLYRDRPELAPRPGKAAGA